ncbi:hypothetical protein MMC30_006113 [Trapelia coarctata]|nr:hypothetical protein [Trapelia coarctata]
MEPATSTNPHTAGTCVFNNIHTSSAHGRGIPTARHPAPSANSRPSGIGGSNNEADSASHGRRDLRRGVMDNAGGSYSSALAFDEALGRQLGEISDTAGRANTSSRRQVRLHNLPSRPNRFVSSSNFVEGHPGFQQTNFQQTGYQQYTFEESSFQQTSFQQTNLQQSNLQQSRMRNMFEGSSSAETDENTRGESRRHEQSRTRNMFDGSSSAATPSSQRRDIHGVPYTSSVLPTQPPRGRRMDDEVGSSLADNSDAGSVSYSRGIGFDANAVRHTLISTPETLVRGIPPPTRQPPPPPGEAQISSDTLMHPPNPRYQRQFCMVEDENGRRIMVPEYRYSPGSTITRRDAHDNPVEGTMASYTHPRLLSRPVPNPFVTPPPQFLLGGRRVEDDDMMVGRDEVGRMQNANVGGGDRAAARLSAGGRIHGPAGEVADNADGDIFRHRYHRSDNSATSTEANPPTTAPTRDREDSVRRPVVPSTVLERHRQDLAARGLITPTRPPPTHYRPTHNFDIEEPPRMATGDSRGSAAMAAAFGLIQGLRRIPDEEEMVSVPMGNHLPVGGPPRLQQTARAYRACLAEKQAMTSLAIFLLCGIFPPAWLLYACGGFDWYMRHVTRGAVETMDKEYKNAAWVVGTVWGLVAVAVFTLIIIEISQ